MKQSTYSNILIICLYNYFAWNFHWPKFDGLCLKLVVISFSVFVGWTPLRHTSLTWPLLICHLFWYPAVFLHSPFSPPTATHRHSSHSRLLTPWSACSSPRCHALLHLSLWEVLSVTPPFPPHPTLASIRSALNAQYHSHLLYEIPLILICKNWLPPKQMHVFAKPLLVPVFTHLLPGTCLAGFGLPSLPSFPRHPVHRVCSVVDCIQHPWIISITSKEMGYWKGS